MPRILDYNPVTTKLAIMLILSQGLSISVLWGKFFQSLSFPGGGEVPGTSGDAHQLKASRSPLTQAPAPELTVSTLLPTKIMMQNLSTLLVFTRNSITSRFW